MTTFKAKHKETGEVMKVHCSNNKKDATPYFDGTWMSESDFNQLYTRLDEPEVVTEEQKHLNRTMNDLKDNLSLSIKPIFMTDEPTSFAGKDRINGELAVFWHEISEGLPHSIERAALGDEKILRAIRPAYIKMREYLLTTIEAEVKGLRKPKQHPFEESDDGYNHALDDILAIISKYKN